MSPKRSGPLAYVAAGGAVTTRCGRDVTAAAATLLEFYRREANGRRLADAEGAAFCDRMALELTGALASVANWRRAAIGLAPASAHRPARTARLTRDLSPRSEG